MIAGNLEQNIQKNEQQANIERSGNKRRFIDSQPKQNTFADPNTVLPPSMSYQSMQPPPLHRQQTTIPLTPNLKHSDPQNIRLYDDRHVFKRSNSQNEFDFLQGNGYGLLDLNDIGNMIHNGQEHDIFGANHP